MIRVISSDIENFIIQVSSSQQIGNSVCVNVQFYYGIEAYTILATHALRILEKQ